MATDAELLHSYATEHSESAFAELVERHIHAVYRAALRQLNGNTHLAEEVTQAVFLQLARKAPRLSVSTILAGWLYTTTHYTVANVRRAEQRRFRREQEAYRMNELQSDSSDRLRWELLRPVLDEALWSLTPADRDVVLLRFFEAKSYLEISHTLRVSEDGARMRVERALKKLHRVLASRGLASTTAILAEVLIAQPAIAASPTLVGTVTQNAMALPAATGTTATLIGAMTTTKAAIIATATTLVLSVIVLTVEHRQMRDAADEVTQRDRERHALLASVRAAAQKLDSSRRTVAALEAENVKAAAIRSAPPATPSVGTTGAETTAAPPAQNPVEAGKAFLKRHPAVQVALDDKWAANVRSQYQQLYDELKLTPGEIVKFEALMRQGRSWGRELSFGTAMFKSEEKSNTWREDLRAVLGPDGFRKYAAYSTQSQTRDVVENLASLTVSTDTPLTRTQAQQLTAIFAAHVKKDAPLGFDSNAAFAQAAGILLPSQLALLHVLQTRAESWEKVLEAGRK